jgi:3-mercaptopyruvate sulfurtransferase SseA
MKQEKNRELVKAQKMDQSASVEAYCGSGYSSSKYGTSCASAYTCNANGVSSPHEDDDILL